MEKEIIIDNVAAEKAFNRLYVAKKSNKPAPELALDDKIAVLLAIGPRIDLMESILGELAGEIENSKMGSLYASLGADADDEEIVFRAPDGKRFSPIKKFDEKFSFDAIKKAAKDPGEYELLPDEIKKPGLVSSAKIKALWKERRLGIYNDKCSCETKEVMKLKEI